MQQKYQELYDKIIDLLTTKTGSKEHAEELFADMGPTVILEATNKMLDEVEQMEKMATTKVGTLADVVMKLESGDEEGAYGIINQLGIDSSKIMRDTFMNVLNGILAIENE